MKTILLAGILASLMAAQTLTEPPPFLQLIRKPRIGASPIRPYPEARAAVNVIGMTAVTGTPEVWLVEAHPGTHVFLAPLTSLRTLDDAMAKTPLFAEAFGAAETVEKSWPLRPRSAARTCFSAWNRVSARCRTILRRQARGSCGESVRNSSLNAISV